MAIEQILAWIAVLSTVYKWFETDYDVKNWLIFSRNTALFMLVIWSIL